MQVHLKSMPYKLQRPYSKQGLLSVCNCSLFLFFLPRVECRKILYTYFSLKEMFLHRRLNNLSSICHNGSFLYTVTICAHYSCTNKFYSTASVFDAWVMRRLAQYQHTAPSKKASMLRDGIPGQTPVPWTASQPWNWQENLQWGEETQIPGTVNSFLI